MAIISILLVACSGSTGSASRPGGPARPNIVFVLTDDLSLNLVPYMPHVLALQRQGTSFSNYSVTDSLCCPSRSSIFTGNFPHDTKVFTNTGKDGGFHVFHDRGEEKATFATSLQSAGYRTAMMGKYLNEYDPRAKLGGSKPYVPPGWTEWDVAGNGYPEYDYNLNSNGSVAFHGKRPADYLTNVLTAKASAFVSRSAAAHQPFMLEVATFAPHEPYTPAPADSSSFPGLKAPRTAAFDTLPTDAPGWLARSPALKSGQLRAIDSDFRKRVQAVQSVDRMIGHLEAVLRSKGLANDTYLVFSSDNGYHMGEYRLNPGKMTAFDIDVHVPLLVSGPGVAAGRTVSAPAENVDLAPTFEDIGGAQVPANIDGRSLLTLLTRGATAWRTAALIEHHGPNTNPADPDHPAPGSGNPPSYEALRTSTYTYVEYVDGGAEFYDRTSDPDELHNTVGQLSSHTRAELHNALQALKNCHGQSACWAAGRLLPNGPPPG